MWKTMNYLRKKKPEVSVLRGLRAGGVLNVECWDVDESPLRGCTCLKCTNVLYGVECWDIGESPLRGG